jgi:ankyrin repeat protein
MNSYDLQYNFERLCDNGNIDKINQFLEDNKTEFTLNETTGEFPLRRACQHGNFKVVKLLHEKGLNIHLKNDIGLGLCCPAHYGERFQILQYLIQHGADIHRECDYPLFWCSIYHDVKAVKFLLKSGAKIHYTKQEYTQELKKQQQQKPFYKHADTFKTTTLYTTNGISGFEHCPDEYREVLLLLMDYGADTKEIHPECSLEIQSFISDYLPVSPRKRFLV